MRRLLLYVVLIAAGALVSGPASAETVDVALVLAADVSRSVDNVEFRLQREGYANALVSARVLKAIAAGRHGAIAVTFVEWSGPEEQKTVADWTIVRDGETAQPFYKTLMEADRSFTGRTSISAAIDFAMAALDKSGVQAERRVIDISGDGNNNAGRPVLEARAAALAAGVTINGLAIINEHPLPGFSAHTQPPEGLPEYYRRNITGGPGSFLLVVQDFTTFGEAMVDKLVNEIAGVPAPIRLTKSQ
jgi:hypothetical protein